MTIIMPGFPSHLVFSRLDISGISNAVRMSFRGAYRLSPTRDELSLFGIDRSSFEESTCIATLSTLDKVLLEWFSNNSTRLDEYLSESEAQEPQKHRCTSLPRECFYLSPHHHKRRSRRCPDVQKYSHRFPDDGIMEAESQESYVSTLNSLDWRFYRDLEAVDHDFGSLTLWKPLPVDIMDLVVAGAGTREQLWILEGVLYRQMHSVSNAKHRKIFVSLWLAVYRAKRGVQAPFHVFRLLREVVDLAKSLQYVRPPIGLPPSEIEYHCSDRWVLLLLYISKLRARRWSNAADVLKGIRYSTDRFPHGSASDEIGYSGRIPKVFGAAPSRFQDVRDFEAGLIEEVD